MDWSVQRDEETGRQVFKCSLCSYTCPWEKNIGYHMKTHRPGVPLMYCEACDYVASNSTQLGRHRNTTHGPKDSTNGSVIGVAKKKLTVRAAGDVLGEEEFQGDSGARKFDCPVCAKSFFHPSSLVQHQKMHTDYKPFECGECSYRCQKKLSLHLHMRTHTREATFYPCDQCDFMTSSMKSLARHRRQEHGADSHPVQMEPPEPVMMDPRPIKMEPESAPLVSTTTTTAPFKRQLPISKPRVFFPRSPHSAPQQQRLSTLLQLHRRRKLGASKLVYNCPQCPKQLKTRQNLETHIRTHTGEKPYQCSHCDYASSQASNLRTHMRTHVRIGVAPQQQQQQQQQQQNLPKAPLSLACHLCDYIAKTTNMIHIHMKLIHPGAQVEPQVSLNMDEDALPNPAEMVETVHNEVSKVCPHCPLVFQSMQDYRNHLKTHETLPGPINNKLFKCSKCDYVCKLSIGLRLHMKRHEEEELLEDDPEVDPLAMTESMPEIICLDEPPHKFMCPLCQQMFNKESLLDNHMLSHQTQPQFECARCEFSTNNRNQFDAHLLSHKSSISISLVPYLDAPVTAAKADISDEPEIIEQVAPSSSPVISTLLAAPVVHQPPATLPPVVQQPMLLVPTSNQQSYQTPAMPYVSYVTPPPTPVSIDSSPASSSSSSSFHCSFCLKTFRGRQELVHHERVHTGEKPFRCHLCSYSTSQQINLRTHLKSHKNGVIYRCNLCDFTGSNRTSIAVHRNKEHNGASNPPLRFAPQQSQSSTTAAARILTKSLNRLIKPRVNAALKPIDKVVYLTPVSQPEQYQHPVPQLNGFHHQYPAPDYQMLNQMGFPPRQYQQFQPQYSPPPSNMVSLDWGGNRFYPKSRAPKQAPVPGALETGDLERPFQCEFCSRRFRTKQRVKEHIRVHTGEKPYQCSVCNFATSHSTNLQIHLRTHTGEKPFSCKVCDYTCASSAALYLHTRRHTKAYACEFCPRKSSDRGVIARHQERCWNRRRSLQLMGCTN